jgi:lysozyme family protein
MAAAKNETEPSKVSARSISDRFLRAFHFSVLGWETLYAPGHYGDTDWVVAEELKEPGAVIKFGIDQRDHPALDVVSLTVQQAQEIYYEGSRDWSGRVVGGQWSKIRGNFLNEDEWALALFDCVINPGPVALNWIQEILGIRSDGVIGPISLLAINNAGLKELRALLAKRDLYYQTRGPWADKARLGWLARNRDLKNELGVGS